jgi:hypothetical protein
VQIEAPVDAKKVAASVDVDNLDADLFSSFNSKRRRPSVDKTATRDSSKDLAKQPEPKEVQTPAERVKIGSTLGSTKKPPKIDQPSKMDQKRDDGKLTTLVSCP